MAGQAGHIPQVEDGEPVEQGAEADGEVADRIRWLERPLLRPALDDLGEVFAPGEHQFIEERAHLGVVRGARPCLYPEEPAGVDGLAGRNRSTNRASWRHAPSIFRSEARRRRVSSCSRQARASSRMCSFEVK